MYYNDKIIFIALLSFNVCWANPSHKWLSFLNKENHELIIGFDRDIEAGHEQERRQAAIAQALRQYVMHYERSEKIYIGCAFCCVICFYMMVGYIAFLNNVELQK